MQYGVIVPICRVLILERVVGMWIGGDDGAVLAFVHRRGVLLDQRLKQSFFTHAADVIARVAFSIIQDSKIQISLLEHLSRLARDVGKNDVLRSIVADEPQ